MTTIPIDSDDAPPFVLELIFKLKIKDVMTRTLLTAQPDSSLRQIQVIMKENGVTGVPITDGSRLLGMVSVDDIIRALDSGYIEERADRWMTRNLIVLEDDMPLSFGISYLDKYRFGRFPVLNKNTELVGILTSRDVIVALLLEANKQVERLEEKRSGETVAAAAPDSGAYREFRTRTFDFENAGKASLEIKKILKEASVDPKLVRRVAVASYELELNQVVHSDGGTIGFHWDEEQITITADDTGPGIEDIEQAMQEGYSTANDWVRSLGFGAGMGLPNARRVSDEFDINSCGTGTCVRVVIRLPHDKGPHDKGEDREDT
jgi:CBS domain-containing protein/anti-sigma regulatory factor (Ser/Thr protein kinase)